MSRSVRIRTKSELNGPEAAEPGEETMYARGAEGNERISQRERQTGWRWNGG